MKTIDLTTNVPLRTFNIHKWRGAIIEKVLQNKEVFENAGIRTDVFHNHNEKQWNDAKVSKEQIKLSRYPMIQYRSLGGNAGIFGVGEGAEALRIFESLDDASISVGGEEYTSVDVRTQKNEWKPVLSDKLMTYSIRQWIPFSPVKFEQWKKNQRLLKRVELADRALFGHFFHMMDDLGVFVERNRLELFVSAIQHEQFVNCFGVKKMALDVEVMTNCMLTESIGIGQGVSLGFGKIKRIDL